jgi:Rrf2 family transcriptional regulator, nitric oxide-sensitive transcriptional repressor
MHLCGAAVRLSTFTDYSLRLLMYLAAEPRRRVTIAQVAQAFGISENHLTKVAHGLGRQGWLANVRGHGGGLALAVAPQQIVIGEVVRRTENGDRPAACFAAEGPAACAIGGACGLRGALEEAMQAFYRVLDRITVADLVLEPQTLSRLQFIAPPPAASA